MRRLLALIPLLCLSVLAQDADFRRQVRSTQFTREMLEKTTAQQVRDLLNVTDSTGLAPTKENLAALAAHTGGTNGQTFYVQGYATRGDWGQPKAYTLNTNSSVSTNAIAISNSGSEGGRWIHEWDGDVSVFGAIFDPPSTNRYATPTDVTAGLQAAATYLGGIGGGTIVLPPGDGTITAEIDLPPKVGVIGSGGANYTQGFVTNETHVGSPTRLFVPAGYRHNVFAAKGETCRSYGMTPVTPVTLADGSYRTNFLHGGFIRNIQFDQQLTDAGHSIYLDSITSFTVENVTFDLGKGAMIFAWGCNSLHVENVFGLQRGGIILDQSADCIIQGANIGGTRGPVLWLKGNKNIVSASMFFNTANPLPDKRQPFTVNTTDDTITLTYSAPWNTGDLVTFEEDGGTLPAPLSTNATYYLYRVSGNTYKVNTQRKAGAVGGAMDGVGIDLTTSGSGDFTIGPGPTCNIYLDGCDQNILSGVRADQAHWDGVILRGAVYNALIGLGATESGLGSDARATNSAGVVLRNVSSNNRFVGLHVRNRSSSSKALYGVLSDGTGSNNTIDAGELDGVTTSVSGSGVEYTYFDSSNNRMVVYNSADRYIPSFPSSMNIVVGTHGQFTLGPTNGTALTLQGADATAISEHYQFGDTAGRGARAFLYRARGTRTSPSQVQSGDELGSVQFAGRNESSGWQFNMASIDAFALSNVKTTNQHSEIQFKVSDVDQSSRYQAGSFTPATAGNETWLKLTLNPQVSGSNQPLVRVAITNINGAAVLYLKGVTP